MDAANAIAKIRFNSARPQRVQLQRCADFACDLLCMEPGQEFSSTGRCAYYFIAGAGLIKSAKNIKEVGMGHFLASEKDEAHTLVNSSEQRLICLIVSARR